MNNKIESFAPIIDNNTKILILGSIPGKQSLEKQEYYANPRNTFWKILFSLHNENIEETFQVKSIFYKEPLTEKKQLIPYDVLT